MENQKNDNLNLLEAVVQNTEMGKNTLEQIVPMTDDVQFKAELLRQRNVYHQLNQEAHTAIEACGGVLESEGGTITVHGCANRLHAPAGVLHGHNDHRVVMSLAVLAAAAALPLTVDDAEAIQKSWPGFFADAAPLGVEVEDA